MASAAEDDVTSARTRAMASIFLIDVSESIDAASPSIIAQVRSFIFLLEDLFSSFLLSLLDGGTVAHWFVRFQRILQMLSCPGDRTPADGATSAGEDGNLREDKRKM